MLNTRKDIIDFFEKGIFPYKGNIFKIKEEKSEEESKEERIKNFIKYIEDESNGINYELFKKHFNFVVPSALVKQLYETKNKNKNNELVNVIKSRLSDLKYQTEKMSKEEIGNEKPDKILKIVEEIIDFNKKNWKQQGLGLKILTLNQMLSRLPISLAQFKAGNNSQKLKNKIKQLLYSLYHSKKLTKQLYESLVDII